MISKNRTVDIFLQIRVFKTISTFSSFNTEVQPCFYNDKGRVNRTLFIMAIQLT